MRLSCRGRAVVATDIITTFIAKSGEAGSEASTDEESGANAGPDEVTDTSDEE